MPRAPRKSRATPMNAPAHPRVARSDQDGTNATGLSTEPANQRESDFGTQPSPRNGNVSPVKRSCRQPLPATGTSSPTRTASRARARGSSVTRRSTIFSPSATGCSRVPDRPPGSSTDSTTSRDLPGRPGPPPQTETLAALLAEYVASGQKGGPAIRTRRASPGSTPADGRAGDPPNEAPRDEAP